MAEQPTAPQRPLPIFPEHDTEPFWRATKEHRLTYQVCQVCSEVVFFPRRHCTRCGSDRLEVRDSAGRGTIYTFTVIRKSGNRFFSSRGRPQIPAWIDLDEGFRLLSEIDSTTPDALRCGQRVELRWEDCDEVAIPTFIVTDS